MYEFQRKRSAWLLRLSLDRVATTTRTVHPSPTARRRRKRRNIRRRAHGKRRARRGSAKTGRRDYTAPPSASNSSKTALL